MKADYKDVNGRGSTSHLLATVASSWRRSGDVFEIPTRRPLTPTPLLATPQPPCRVPRRFHVQSCVTSWPLMSYSCTTNSWLTASNGHTLTALDTARVDAMMPAISGESARWEYTSIYLINDSPVNWWNILCKSLFFTISMVVTIIKTT